MIFSLVLGILILGVYLPVRTFQFTNYDDPDYVSGNLIVQKGLTAEGVRWAFRTTYASNWHPLTWLSHMLDVQLFGLNPGGHHSMNLVLHIANAILVFLLLQRMTGRFGLSGLVALLFGLHPLNMECVAWIAERKHLLASFFWLLTIGAYISYAQRPNVWRYGVVFLCFVAGLLAKPLLITLPFALLLLDYWPLRRWQGANSPTPSGSAESEVVLPSFTTVSTKRLWVEKIPLLLISVASGIMALIAAGQDDALVSTAKYSLGARIGNALVAYVAYIGKLLVPENVAVLYPHPGMWPIGHVLGAGAILLLISMFVVIFWKSRPYLLMGWLWYLGTLVPMIGLVQVSEHSWANRYIYISGLGLFIMAVWGLHGILVRTRAPWWVQPLASSLVVAMLVVLTSSHLPHWRNSVSLFSHTLGATTNNPIAHYCLAQALSMQGQINDSIPHYEEALRLRPDYAAAHNNLGLSLVLQGNAAEATNHYATAVGLQPENNVFRFNYGAALVHLGKKAEGITQYQEALRIAPTNVMAHVHLASVLAGQQQVDSAILHFEQALRLQPDSADARYYYGRAFLDWGRFEEALVQFRELVRLDPASGSARAQLGDALVAHRKPAEAVREYQEAARLNPRAPLILNNLAWLLATHPDAEIRNGPAAILYAEKVAQLTQRKQAFFLGTLAAAYAEAGRFDDAIRTANEAIDAAQSSGQTQVVQRNRELVELYRQGKAYRQPVAP